MVNQKKGFFERSLIYLGFKNPVEEVRQGSVLSAGGTSPLPGVVPPARPVGTEVTVDTALSMSAVYRSVSILTTTVSQLDVGVWRGATELKTVPGQISRPDINISASTFLKRTVMSLATHGNAYWRLYMNNGVVQNVEVLNPALMFIAYDNNGNREFHYSGYGTDKIFKPSEIKHLKLMEVFGSDYGLGPIQAARAELTGSLDLRDYSSNWFSKGAIPTGVLSSTAYLDADMAAEYRRRWEENQAIRGVAVLGNGMQYQPILLSPQDAQFLENQEFSVTQIARLFGIPANYLLAEVPGGTMTYQNMQDVDTAFVRYTLMEYIREIEEAFTSLLPRGQKARFKTDGLLRANTSTRFEYYKTAIDAGILTIDEVRDMEGLLPLPPGAAPAEKPKAVDTEGTSNGL